MAILDRPLFQRRLTKEELKAYGIPAFANGGIVVQKFAPGGDVQSGPTLPGARDPIYPGLMIQADAVERQGALGGSGGDTGLYDTIMEDVQKEGELKSDLNVAILDVRQLEDRIKQVQARIDEKKALNLDASAEQAELNALKSQLVEAQKKQSQAQEKVSQPVVEETGATGTVTDAEPEKEITEEEDELSRLKTLALERSDLYKQMLGDPKEMMKQQGLLQLAQFGLNLASARGGNLAEKIAKSARDPLQAFAQLASDASKDARAIDLAAIKSAEDQLALETELAGKQDDLVKINLYTETKSDMPGDTAGAAAASGFLPKGEMKDIDVYRDDSSRISSKEINKAGAGNEVFRDTEGNPWKIKDGALQNKKYLTFPEDFEKVEGVEIITPGS